MTGTVAPAGALVAVEDYLERTAQERLDDYVEFLRIPSISTLERTP